MEAKNFNSSSFPYINELKITQTGSDGKNNIYHATGKINGRQFSVTVETKGKVNEKDLQNILNYSHVGKIKERKAEAKIELKHKGFKDAKITVITKLSSATDEFRVKQAAQPLSYSKTQKLFNSFKEELGKASEASKQSVKETKTNVETQVTEKVKSLPADAARIGNTAQSVMKDAFSNISKVVKSSAKSVGDEISSLKGRIEVKIEEQLPHKLTRFNPIMSSEKERKSIDDMNAQLIELQNYFSQRADSGGNVKSFNAKEILKRLDNIIDNAPRTESKTLAIENLLKKTFEHAEILGIPRTRIEAAESKFNNKFYEDTADEKPIANLRAHTMIPIHFGPVSGSAHSAQATAPPESPA